MKTKKDAEEFIAGDDDNSETEIVEVEPISGQGRIPGTGIKVVKKLVNFVRRHEDTKAEHKIFTERLTLENNEALMLFGKYKEYFEENEKGNWVYEAGDAYLEITKPGELKVKTKLLNTDTDASAESSDE